MSRSIALTISIALLIPAMAMSQQPKDEGVRAESTPKDDLPWQSLDIYQARVATDGKITRVLVVVQSQKRVHNIKVARGPAAGRNTAPKFYAIGQVAPTEPPNSTFQIVGVDVGEDDVGAGYVVVCGKNMRVELPLPGRAGDFTKGYHDFNLPASSSARR